MDGRTAVKSFPAAIAGAALCGTPAGAFKDQWKDSDKSLSEYISDGFELQQTLIRYVSPFAKYEYVYFLRKMSGSRDASNQS